MRKKTTPGQRSASRKSKFITFSLFCGCGGEHMGKTMALKKLIPVSECQFFALNHWQIAVDTLQRNFPHAMTFCESIEQSSAQTFGFPRIDLLWASPSCVHHSNARGGKPRDDQQRAHATEVLERWLRQADIPVFIMENVREFLSWGPLDAFGRPVKERKGEYFNGFVSNLKELGYEVDWKILNAADYGDPTTRKRLFLQAVKDGHGIHWPEPTHRDPRKDGDLPLWKSAKDHVIDWSIAGKSIYYRKKPLAKDTIRRIVHGLKKYGLRDYFVSFHGGPDSERRVYPTEMPVMTLDTSNRYGLVQPWLSKSFGPRCTCPSTDMNQPLPTITTIDHNHLAQPFLIQHYGWQTDRGEGGVSTQKPFPAISTAQHHSLVEPFFIKNDFTHSGDRRAESPDNPMSTVVTRLRHCLVEPSILQNYGHGGVRSVRLPWPTITTQPKQNSVMQTFFIEYYGSSKSVPVSEPIPTITTKDRHGLIDLIIEHEGSVDNLPVVRTEEDINAHDFSRPFCVEIGDVRYPVDITLRMLEPRELANAMSVPDWFEFQTCDGKPLTKTDSVKMIGNMVSVKLTEAIVYAVMEPRIDQKKKTQKHPHHSNH